MSYYAKISYPKEERFKWIEIPTTDIQTAAMMAMCYCCGYNEGGEDNPMLFSLVETIQRDFPKEIGATTLIPFGGLYLKS